MEIYVELSPLRTAKRKVTEAIKAVEEVSSKEPGSFRTFLRAPSDVYNEHQQSTSRDDMTARDSIYLIMP